MFVPLTVVVLWCGAGYFGAAFGLPGHAPFNRPKDTENIIEYPKSINTPANALHSTAYTLRHAGTSFTPLRSISDTPEAARARSGILRTLAKGDYFGERGLIFTEPRSATCAAVDDVEAPRDSEFVLTGCVGLSEI